MSRCKYDTTPTSQGQPDITEDFAQKPCNDHQGFALYGMIERIEVLHGAVQYSTLCATMSSDITQLTSICASFDVDKHTDTAPEERKIFTNTLSKYIQSLVDYHTDWSVAQCAEILAAFNKNKPILPCYTNAFSSLIQCIIKKWIVFDDQTCSLAMPGATASNPLISNETLDASTSAADHKSFDSANAVPSNAPVARATQRFGIFDRTSTPDVVFTRLQITQPQARWSVVPASNRTPGTARASGASKDPAFVDPNHSSSAALLGASRDSLKFNELKVGAPKQEFVVSLHTYFYQLCKLLRHNPRATS